MKNEKTQTRVVNDSVIEKYYSRGDIISKFNDFIKTTGKDINSITEDDIAMVDQFHLRGNLATDELLKHIPLSKETTVLDVGCGIGGLCRTIASRYKSKVSGVDISNEFIKAANEITRYTKLQNYLNFTKGSATALPYEDESFKVVTTQHVQMNINDKETFIREVERVLDIDGFFGFVDIFEKGTGPVNYPVPWADNEDISFLTTYDNWEEILKKNNLHRIYVEDKTKDSLTWLDEGIKNVPGTGKPAPQVHLFLGEDAMVRINNVRRGLEENKIHPVLGVYQKR